MNFAELRAEGVKTICNVLAERVEPEDIGTALFYFTADRIAVAIILDSHFKFGKFPPQLAAYYQRIITERDEALAALEIANPYSGGKVN
jgi:hypothetical protein